MEQIETVHDGVQWAKAVRAQITEGRQSDGLDFIKVETPDGLSRTGIFDNSLEGEEREDAKARAFIDACEQLRQYRGN